MSTPAATLSRRVATERVRISRDRIARQGDPIGLQSAFRVVDASVIDGEIRPTDERVDRAPHGIDAPEVSRETVRRAHYVRDVFDDLRRRQQIGDDAFEAGKRFARHMELATRGRAITPSYGTRFAEGTPVHQMAGLAEAEDAARTVDYWRLHEDAKAALPPSARLAMCMASTGESMSTIGRFLHRAGGHADKVAAVGVTAIRIGLEILVDYYQMRPRVA